MEKYRANNAAKKHSTQNQKSSLPSKQKKSLEKRKESQKRREEKIRKAQMRKKRRGQLFRLSFAASLIFVLLYWAFVGISILGRDKGGEKQLPLMLFTEGKIKEDKTIEAKEITVGNVKYLSITDLSDYFTASQYGDHKTRSIRLLDDGGWATFYLGSEEAVINSVHVSLSAPAIVKDDNLYLPVDFFGDKMTCFTYSPAVASYGADVLTFRESEPISFYTDLCPESEVVSYSTVPIAPTLPEEENTENVENPEEPGETPN